MKKVVLPIITTVLTLGSMSVMAQELKIALGADPDILDPHRARTMVGRVVFTSLCDKLVDVDDKLNIVPQLATSWEWSENNTVLTFKLRSDGLFHDGTKIDAAAVKANLDRALTLPDSLRRSEISSVKQVDVVDPLTVKLTLSEPNVSLLSQFTDRAGMMISPKQFESDNVGRAPVCSGPYKFVERVQNDRIVLEKFTQHWDAANYHFNKVIFSAIPDATVRLANLRSGDYQIIERLAPNDMQAVKDDPKLRMDFVTSLGYQAVAFNLTKGQPWSNDKRVRQAFDLSIDRNVINQVAGLGTFLPARQPFPPASFANNPALDKQGRDIAKAKALLAAAGVKGPVNVEISFGTNASAQQVFELIQAMSAEAGFNVTLRPTEFATLQSVLKRGDFQVGQTGWSGRIDPDGNIHMKVACDGALNDARFCNKQVDDYLNQARKVASNEERKALYDKAMAIVNDELPVLYLYYQPWVFASTQKLEGFKAMPDGMIRLRGVSLKP